MTASIHDVVVNDACVGCGACVLATGGSVQLRLTRDRRYVADLSGVDEEAEAAASAACPFSYDRLDVDELAARQEWSGLSRDTAVGHRAGIYTGRILSEERIVASSSGGLTTWLLQELLARRLVDGVIHVGPQKPDGDGVLFGYRVSPTAGELEANRKSHYYATNYVDAVNQIRGDGKRYAFVGVSCFVSSLRQLTEQDPELRAQIRFCVGLVCGHLKTQNYAASLAWQVGVPPRELVDVDFRVKVPDASVTSYAFGARGTSDHELRVRPNRELLGTNWGHTAFQLKACDFCDDIFAEAADVTFGDAWLPEFSSVWQGTNIVVTRHPVLDSLLRTGRDRGEIVLEETTSERAVESQGGNFRHRRSGLVTRVEMDTARGRWVPPTRASILELVPYRGPRRRLVAFRRATASASSTLFAAALRTGRLSTYIAPMRVVLATYKAIDRHARRSAQGPDPAADNMNVRPREYDSG